MLIIICAVGLIALGLTLGSLGLGSANLSTIMVISGALLLPIGLIIQFFQTFYRKPGADESFVRTGLGGPKVIIDGGFIFVPLFHKLTVVSLKTSKLIVKNEGAQGALRTLDNLKADIEAAFFVRIAANPDNIMNAARTLGQSASNEQAVEDKIKEKLVSGLRSVAATQRLESLLRNRETFANEVHGHLAPELNHQGLTLESVLIIQIDQSDLSSYDDNNVFDAQGKRAATEIVQQAAVERNRIQNEARAAIAQKDVETAKQILTLEQDQAQAQAEQEAQIAMIQSDQKRQKDVYVIEQEQLTQLRQVEADQAVAVRNVEKNKRVGLLNLEKDKSVALLNVEKVQATQVAEVVQQTTVETARRQQQVDLANKERERAEAEAARLRAEAERQKAEETIYMVQVEQAAEREKRKKVLDAEATAREKMIDQEAIANAAAYTRQKAAEAEAEALIRQAEGSKIAAQAQAEATIKAAEAAQEARRLAAQGEQVAQMVPVIVAQEQVNVTAAQIEVERKQMEYRQANAEAGIELQIRLKQIEADRDVKVAQAESMGEALGNAQMRVVTDAQSLQSLMTALTRGMQTGMLLEGLSDATPPEIKSLAASAGSGLLSLLMKRLTGLEMTEDQVRTVLSDLVHSSNGDAASQ